MIEIPDAPESETERDGVFSSAPEVHAFVIGLALGIAVSAPEGIALVSSFVLVIVGARDAQRKWNKKVLRETKREPWYFTGGLVLALPVGLFLLGATIL